MKVSFIIPVYGHLDITRKCIESLRSTVQNVPYELIIVDDGSEADCRVGLEKLRNYNTRIIHNPENLGYAHSNNVGAKSATGDILFLLNNDLEFQQNWFEPMLKAFDRFPKL